MNNIFGIKNIQVKQFLLNTADPTTFDKFNEALESYKYDGNIIDIQFVGQALGQICAILTYQEEM